MSVWKAGLLLALSLVVSCSSGVPAGPGRPAAEAGSRTSPASSPRSATTSPGPLGPLPVGLVVKDFLVDGGPTYTVTLVGEDGRIVASATGAKRRRPAGVLVQMPNVSASGSRVYYLDGDSKVMVLTPGGATGSATSIAVDQNSAAVFSVSPDDRRIAVAVLTFPYPARTRIYVEDLTGGGHHVELFSSSAELEWPVGWHQGHLVIAVGTNAHPQNAYEGFTYANRGYHVADADTGDRLATVCDGFDANTPPVPAGTTCVNDPSYEVSDWAGAVRSVSGDTGCGGGALSPDGSWIARCHGANPRTVVLLARDGATKSTNVQATPVGWIDASRVVVRADTPDASLMILNVQTLQLTPIQAKGFFGGSVPGGL